MVGTSGICGTRLHAAEAQHVELAGLDGRQRDRRAHRDHVDVAGDQVVERGRGAAIVHRRELDAGQAFQQQRGGVRRGADARGAVGQRAGLLLGERDQLRRPTSPAPMGCTSSADRDAGVARDRDEVGLRVVGQLALGVEMRLAGDRSRFRRRAACSRRLGADLTAVAAKLCPAPPRFSTTTLWPHFCDSRWPTARVSTSVSAPAAEVTTMVTVRLG